MNLERINLVPQKPFSERVKNVTPFVLLLVTVVIVAVVYMNNSHISGKIKKIEREISKIEKANENATLLIAARQRLALEIERLEKQHGTLSVNTTKLEKIYEKKRSLSQALLRIAGVLPPTVKCNKISFLGENGNIEGMALSYNDPPRIVKQLKKDSLFKDVVLQDIDKVTEDTKKSLNFNIMFTLN